MTIAVHAAGIVNVNHVSIVGLVMSSRTLPNADDPRGGTPMNTDDELQRYKMEALLWKQKYVHMKVKHQRTFEYDAQPSEKLAAMLSQKQRVDKQVERMRNEQS